MEYEKAVVALDVLFSKEPANEVLYAGALEHCVNRVPERDAADYVDSIRDKIQQIQDGESIVSVLIRRGGLDRIIVVDGEEYEGTLEDLQADDSVPDDAEIESYVQTTEAGRAVSDSFRASNSMQALFAQAPQHVQGFKEVLRQCLDSEGRTTAELQQELIDAGIIGPGNSQAQVIHASYFTSKLERFGALAWRGKRWHTTEKGEAAL